MRIREKVKFMFRSGIATAFVVAIAVGVLGAPAAQALDVNDASGKMQQHKAPSASQRATSPRAPGEMFDAECPPTVRCVVVPAAYSMNNNDVGDYGNYDKANRPVDMSINSIVIHDTEGGLQSVLNAFQNPTFYASSHYVIDKDGTIYQMVQNKNVAWHAGNWDYNMHSIGIEHVGYARTGGVDYTPEMYRASSALVKWLTKKYGIPYDRQHIVGHDNIPAPNAGRLTGMHVDPGPYWNWQNYMLMGKLSMQPFGQSSAKFVTIAPVWPFNKQVVTGCWPGPEDCVPSTPQPANFAYVRTAPQKDAPLITDKVLGAGTTDLSNTIARVFYGQTFAVNDMKLDRDGMWYKIWVNNGTGWVFSPWLAPTAFPSSSGNYALAKTGQESIPVYGRPLPQLAEYPSDLQAPAGAIPAPNPLPLRINKGERYKVMAGPMKASHYYSWTIDASLPYERTVFNGADEYYLVQYGNRPYFVKKADVDIK